MKELPITVGNQQKEITAVEGKEEAFMAEEWIEREMVHLIEEDKETTVDEMAEEELQPHHISRTDHTT